jgi:streptogramin lyase
MRTTPRPDRVCRTLTAILTLAGLVQSTPAQSRTYTLDADFDQGLLVNVNHDAPNNDQLQLNTSTTPFPFVNVACSARGTIVRIDVNTGVILGEYLTAPDLMGRDPSRTTVDLFGNVWVSNRGEAGISGGQSKGSITRVGLVIGGTRTDAGGNPDPNGQYLRPPFAYSTVLDRDGDGLIRTSRGLLNILPWTNAGGADTDGGVSTAEDECIINYTRIVGANARTVAIDANNDVWTGGLGDLDHEKVSGLTGLPIPGTQFNLGCGGYGGLIDGNGILWSARGGANLLRYDPGTGMGVCLDTSRGDYGLGIDPVTGHIWHTQLFGGNVVEIGPAGNVLNVYPHGNAYAQGVAVDSSANVWVAHSLFSATTVGHLRTNGVFVGNVTLPGGNGPTGVAVDANGKVWVTNINTSNAQRIDPAAGAIGGGGYPIGAVDLTVDLGPGAGPYNYSDMTGFVSIGSTAPQGTWTVVHDSGSAGTDDCTISWNSSEPSGTSVMVDVRAADDPIDLASQSFVAAGNGVVLAGLAGRYYEIRATLTRGANVNDTPILFDLTISCGSPCFTLDFETEDDFTTPLVNGQHIDVEFGSLVTVASSGANAGLGIFVSTPGGPNDPSQDLDLLVDTGNVLILQTENFPPNGQDIFPRPNDDDDGGTMTFHFIEPIEPRCLRLIDLDASDGTSRVILTDLAGRQRTYAVPSNWTGDRMLGQPGQGTLDLLTLAPQAGFGSVATATETALFEPGDVVRIDVEMGGSGALDDLAWCTPTAGLARALAGVRNGSGSNPLILRNVAMPVLGGNWVAELDCSGHARGNAYLFVFSAPAAGAPHSFGEVLVSGNQRYLAIRGHAGGRVAFSAPLPPLISLCGLTGFAQGLCSGRPGPRLSNALDIVLGY